MAEHGVRETFATDAGGPDERLGTAGAVVVALDGSPGDEPVVDWAIDEAARLDAPLRVVSVVDPGVQLTPYEALVSGSPSLADDLEQGARQVLDQAAARARGRQPGLHVATAVPWGPPAAAIVRLSAGALRVVVGAPGPWPSRAHAARVGRPARRRPRALSGGRGTRRHRGGPTPPDRRRGRRQRGQRSRGGDGAGECARQRCLRHLRAGLAPRGPERCGRHRAGERQLGRGRAAVSGARERGRRPAGRTPSGRRRDRRHPAQVPVEGGRGGRSRARRRPHRRRPPWARWLQRPAAGLGEPAGGPARRPCRPRRALPAD